MTPSGTIPEPGVATRRMVWLRVAAVLVVVAAFTFGPAPSASAAQGFDPLRSAMGDDAAQWRTWPSWVRYRIVSSSGFSITSPGKSLRVMVYGTLTDVFWTLAMWVAEAGLWIIVLPYSGVVLLLLLAPAEALSNRLQTTVVGPIELQAFAVFFAVFLSGMQLLRRRTARGINDLVTALLIAVIGAGLVANPGWLLRVLAPQAMAVSAVMLQLGTGKADEPLPDVSLDNNNVGLLVRPLAEGLHKAMIEEPYDLIKWGQVFEDGSVCARRRDKILRGDAWQDPNDARSVMSPPVNGQLNRSEACWGPANHDKEADASATRTLLALMSLLFNIGVFGFLAYSSVVVLRAQFSFGGQTVAVPFAVPAATVQGIPRQLGLRLVSGAGQAWVTIVGMTSVITLLLLLTNALLSARGQPLWLRYLLLLVCFGMLVKARKGILESGQEVVLRATQWLEHRDFDRLGESMLKPRDVSRSLVASRMIERTVDRGYDASLRGGRRIASLPFRTAALPLRGAGALIGRRGRDKGEEGGTRRRRPRLRTTAGRLGFAAAGAAGAHTAGVFGAAGSGIAGAAGAIGSGIAAVATGPVGWAIGGAAVGGATVRHLVRRRRASGSRDPDGSRPERDGDRGRPERGRPERGRPDRRPRPDRPTSGPVPDRTDRDGPSPKPVPNRSPRDRPLPDAMPGPDGGRHRRGRGSSGQTRPDQRLRDPVPPPAGGRHRPGPNRHSPPEPSSPNQVPGRHRQPVRSPVPPPAGDRHRRPDGGGRGQG